MKKITYYNDLLHEDYYKQMKLKMRLTFALFFFALLQLSATNIYSQGEMEFNYKEVPLKKILKTIKVQSGYSFFYNVNEIDDSKKVSLSAKKETLNEVLKRLSAKESLNYKINGKQIVLTKIASVKFPVIKKIKEINGTVKDDEGNPLPGASIIVKGTTIGVTSDFSGNFSIETPDDESILVISFIGFKTQEVDITGKETIAIVLESDSAQLDAVVIVGSRNPNRTATDTSVPVDIIDVTALTTQGAQTSVGEILNYAAPSFTSQSQTVSDGTDHIDPASLRGLGPDQVLILINGKRRHTTSLINVNGTVGAGSVGTDMNAIPTAAIQRIEVLRDGAAAQYGSDAIAGVINIVLKENTGKLDLVLTTGANFSQNSNHFEGGSDGEKVQLDANIGLPIGENGGFINFTGSLSTRQPALRNKDYAGDIFRGFHGAERVFASNGGNVAGMTLQDYATAAQGISYLSQAIKDQISGLDLNNSGDVDAFRGLLDFDADEDELAARGLTRKDFRFKVGTSQLREGKFFVNLALPISENTEIYSFGGISYRKGLASGFYRRPAQGDGRANTPAFPNGFLPNIGSDILDKSMAVGIKTELNGWNVDFSNTYGENTFNITVGNSSNGTLGVATPRNFDAGGFGFMQNTTNLDVNRFFEDTFSGLNVAFGAEFKVENYEITAGEEASYTSYDINGNIVTGTTASDLLVRNNFTGGTLGGGSQVYRGFDPGNAISKFRDNISAYIDLEADFTENWLVSLAGRYESYSDFGDTFNYKLATRLKLSDNVSLRAATSSGFRAPSLHQQYFSRTSTVFVDNVPFEQGTFTNDSRAATLIGIDKLKEETSTSLSAGLTGKFGNLSVTLDAYQINIDDRIIYSGSFGNGGDPELTTIFTSAGATSARFFANAIDTKSTGVDVVISHKANFGENTTLKNDLAATFSKTEVDNIFVPEKIVNAGLGGAFFDGQEEAFLTLAQPRTKLNLTHLLSVGSWDFLLRNSYFGEVTDPDDFNGDARVAGTTVSNDAVYGGKLITDLTFTKSIGENLKIIVGANNLLDVYPDENRAGGTSGDQFVYSRRTSQFGYSGRFLFARLKLSL